MEDIAVSSYILAFLFMMTAFAYSSVGLGGASSYTSLMAIAGVSYIAIPTISLSLNLLVTSVGSFNFIRKGHARLRLIIPFLVSSIPMSYIGGSLAVSRDIFYWILLLTLIFVALRIYAWNDTPLRRRINGNLRIAVSLAAGSILGLVAGIVGIGGGIYLVPLIIILGLGSEKEAAACGAIFIFVNSLSGLTARSLHNPVDVIQFMPLIGAVLAGGAAGSFLGSSKFRPGTIQKVLGVIVIVAIISLARKILTA